MANNGPISVSSAGTSLQNASGAQVTFNTRYPFHKLDSTNINSFQVVTILFGAEPPNPVAPTSTATYSESLVYSFAHGYTYVPSTWFLLSLDGFATTIGPEGNAFLVQGQIPGSTNAILNIRVDATNVNFYVTKTWGYVFGTPDPVAPNVFGLTVSIRSYVFVEDLLGNSLPSSA